MGIYKHDKTNACFERESGKGAIPCFPSGIHLAVPASSLRMNQSIRSTADALLFKQLPTCTLVDPAMPIPNKNAESSRQNRFRRGFLLVCDPYRPAWQIMSSSFPAIFLSRVFSWSGVFIRVTFHIAYRYNNVPSGYFAFGLKITGLFVWNLICIQVSILYAKFSSIKWKRTELHQSASPSSFRKYRFRDLGIFSRHSTLHPIESAPCQWVILVLQTVFLLSIMIIYKKAYLSS